MCNTVIYLSFKELHNKEKREEDFVLFFKVYTTSLRKLSLEYNLTGSWHRNTVQICNKDNKDSVKIETE